MKIVYLVHDLNDPAVARRVRMLHAAGGEVRLLGFSRGPAPDVVDGVVPRALGQTADARLVQRAWAVLRAALTIPAWRAEIAGADLILARQVETLALAWLARVYHARGLRLVYECLDVHRLMCGRGIAGRLMRALEGGLLRHCQALVVSSPEFVRAHFEPSYTTLPPVVLMENKVLSFELGDPGAGTERPAPPPWRIGWYGNIRCARSLALLADLVRRQEGRVVVEIRGRVARTAVPEFDAVVAATPGLHFGGAYDRARDLSTLYGAVHFAWAIDFFESGANSDWLLPNRLYEAGLFGAVPIAMAHVATGAWLARNRVGVRLDGDPAAALDALFLTLDGPRYAAFAVDLARLPKNAFLDTVQDCRTLAQRIVNTGAAGRVELADAPAQLSM